MIWCRHVRLRRCKSYVVAVNTTKTAIIGSTGKEELHFCFVYPSSILFSFSVASHRVSVKLDVALQYGSLSVQYRGASSSDDSYGNTLV